MKYFVKEEELGILQEEAIALTPEALPWSRGKAIPCGLYANVTGLQIHEDMNFTVMSFCTFLIGTKKTV